MGRRVKFTRGQPAITDGPFIETKELIAGFSIIRVNSRQEAIDWAKRWPPSDAGGNIEIEIRQIIEPEDFALKPPPRKKCGPLFGENPRRERFLTRQTPFGMTN
jgi:hypothetical protein